VLGFLARHLVCEGTSRTLSGRSQAQPLYGRAYLRGFDANDEVLLRGRSRGPSLAKQLNTRHQFLRVNKKVIYSLAYHESLILLSQTLSYEFGSNRARNHG